MKLYRIEYGTTDEFENNLVCVQWAGTALLSQTAKKQLLEGKAYDIQVDQVEVPTDKEGLLAWLNEHMAGDLSQ